jgi:transcriptional regulator with XRE-family HTH domain
MNKPKRGKSFGRTRRDRRLTFGYTQRELAAKLGIKASHVAYLENGHRKPSLALLMRIAKVLNFRPGYIALKVRPELVYFGVR